VDTKAFAYENPRPDVAALVPRGVTRVLDLGCSSGALGEAIKQREGCQVVGVEADADRAARAGERLDRVVHADLERFAGAGWREELGRFDCLVAADVLEHLRDPWLVLASAVDLLDAGGSAVISLPNVRYWDTFRHLLLRGTWPRYDEGIFDRTHLRWFTQGDARALLESAGLRVDRVDPIYRLRPSDWRTREAGERLARGPLKEFLAFQYVLRGRRP
jgi:methionine biosynthesis protein MetW